MELETFKSIWKEQDQPPEEKTSRNELLALLQKRSRGPIARMRRNLRIEALLMIVSYLPCILFYWWGFEGRMSGISWLMAGLFLGFYIYYYRKNRLLKQMECVSCEVRSNLAGQLKTLKKYIRFYFWSSTLVVPAMAFFSFEIALHNRAPQDPPFSWWKGISLLLALIISLTVGIYYFNKWYINKLYGRHILKLQNLLREMDEG